MLTVSISSSMSCFEVLPARLVPVVPPRTRERLTGLPRHADAVHLHPLGRFELLGRPEVPSAGHIEQVQTVVDDDPRLEFAHHLEQADRVPVVASLAMPAAGEREVEPDDVDLAVVGQQFANLVLHVLPVDRHVAPRVELLVVGRVGRALRVVAVDRVGRMVPVEERVVEPDAQPLRAERVHPRLQEVALRGRVGRLVVGDRRVEQGEALVVLGRDDRVLHAGALRLPRPLARVVQVRVEQVEVLLVLGVGHPLVLLDPLVAGGLRVEAPVNEHPEPRVGPPGQARLLLGRRFGRQLRRCRGLSPGTRDHQHHGDEDRGQQRSHGGTSELD